MSAAAMSSETRQTLTLYRALKNCGGEAELAKALDVSVESLSRWLTGHEAPSVKVYMAALSLVAAGRIKRAKST
ncbi:MAG: helix-turn-helix domain-containing protein [Betaproteobacteria bacterium]|nr:MAG: helix-turn-helix domain-containing protein [Betaproteobacteria bacterium]TMI02279.1 MAG: helix-turn-helix domain-containing protein [Betaproteobacteria bacterium]